jgi:hypothetical protein
VCHAKHLQHLLTVHCCRLQQLLLLVIAGMHPGSVLLL